VKTNALSDAEIEPSSQALTATLKEARAAMQTFDAAASATQKFFAGNAALGDEVTVALQQLGDAAASVSRLAEFLERNPNALIVGRKRPE